MTEYVRLWLNGLHLHDRLWTVGFLLEKEYRPVPLEIQPDLLGFMHYYSLYIPALVSRWT
jgi:hypothetical protein